MQITFQHSIRGILVGSIWMPAATCAKPLNYNATREESNWINAGRNNGKGTLREHVLAATRDGDFQSCRLADGELVTVATITRGKRTYRRTRTTVLTRCKSIADCLANEEETYAALDCLSDCDD
jgi:hypothetical protein